VVRFSEVEKAQIEALWRSGATGRVIARELGRSPRGVWGYVEVLRRRRAGGRTRSALRLSLAEREDISRGLAGGESLRVIAARLGRAPSTISREVAANGGRRRYRAVRADEAAWKRALRPKTQKLEQSELVRWLVEAGLERKWSPEQVAGWLRRSFPDRPELWVSHETIYQSLNSRPRRLAQGTDRSSPPTPGIAAPTRLLDPQRTGPAPRCPEHQRTTSPSR
jgi:IS30 family transposase